MDNFQSSRTQNTTNPEDFAQPLYDRANYAAAGQTSITWFANPIGQTVRLIVGGVAGNNIKTLRDTNLQTASQMSSKIYKVTGISLAFVHLTEGLSTNVADRDRLRGGGVIQWKIGDKVILDAPMIMIPELNPFAGVATTANATTMVPQASAGRGAYNLQIPVTINPGENFSVVATFAGSPVTTSDVDIYVFLHALMRRPS